MNLLNTKDIYSQNVEYLPFKVEIATRQDLVRVANLRSASYGKHLPSLGSQLKQPEAADFERGCEVFVATSKLDGSTLGTLRTHANVSNPLPLQASMRLPSRFRGTRMVETTRLSILGGTSSSVVRCALFKALFEYCVVQNVDWMMAAGRRPVDRIYDSLLFADVGEPKAFFPMAHADGVPHRVMNFSPERAKSLWAQEDHPLYQFVFETTHPDIDLSRAQSLDYVWDCPETSRVSAYRQEQSIAPTFSLPWARFPSGLAA